MKDKKADNKDRLLQIENAIIRIESFIAGISEDDFIKSSLISSAALFQFSVIGEAVGNVEKSLLDKYPYKWYKVKAFRNLISHEYFRIELSAVWEVVIKDLPELKEMIRKMLNQEF